MNVVPLKYNQNPDGLMSHLPSAVGGRRIYKRDLLGGQSFLHLCLVSELWQLSLAVRNVHIQ